MVKTIRKNKVEILTDYFLSDFEYPDPRYNIDIHQIDVILEGRETKTVRRESCQNLILAIPQEALKEIPRLVSAMPKYKDMSLLDTVSGRPLHRVYAIYPAGGSGAGSGAGSGTGSVWFHDLKTTSTDNVLRLIIPIDVKTGLIMISYTDADHADLWNDSHQGGYLKRDIQQQLKKLFPDREIPDPIWMESDYWDVGAHYWKPGVDSRRAHDKIIQPWKNKNVFICGEAYSFRQAWMEGALETCEKVLKKN